METITARAYYAMEDALCDSATVPLEFNPLGFNTGLSVTLEDLERLFSLMAKAAHLFRMIDGPVPVYQADTWKRAAGRCKAVCRTASEEYLSLCLGKGQPITGEIRERESSWKYMANLFDTWPDLSGLTRVEPSCIAEAAASEAVEVHEDPGNENHLLYIPTSYNQSELCCIFAGLVEGGFIDGSAPGSEQDFLNTFDPKAKQNGRIIWIKKAKSHTLNKMAICDFLRLLGITGREDLREYASAIFGVSIGKSTLTNCVGGSAERKALQTIIDKAAKQ
ncbi:MAG: hypothetical protein IKO88_00405 [Bacteroidales bacterium]|nr:hypothetical protein [Bacteroidales bacterium]